MARTIPLLDEALALDEAGQREWLAALEPKHQDISCRTTRRGIPYSVAQVYAWRGENGKAFEWLERAYKRRDNDMINIRYDPLISRL